MRKFHRSLLLALVLPVLMFSCVVSKKKYDDLNVKKSTLEVENAEQAEEIKILDADNQRLSEMINRYKDQVDELVRDTTEALATYRDLKRQYNSLSEISNADAQNLKRQLDRVNKLQKDLEEKEKLSKVSQEEIERLRTDLEVREKRVNELEKIIADKDKAVKELRDKIKKALLSFKDTDLTVEMRDGKVYVSLAEQLLFKSGSYSVDVKGADALKKLSAVLKEQAGFDIIVEGHTDDVPLSKGATLRDNWDLSVMRATSIVRILADAGVDPKRVQAAGRGEFTPKVNEKTTEARAKNRRTEIIISPNLDQLFEILENK